MLVHPVNEQQAVEMIRLVLHGARQQAAAPEFNRLAPGVQPFYIHHAGALDVGINLGKAQATLAALHRFARRGDLGVD